MCLNSSTVGWSPAGYEHLPLGISSNDTIAGLEIRVFRVFVDERSSATEAIVPLTQQRDYAYEPTRLLRLSHGLGDLPHELASKPSFKTRFRGVMVDSAFVHSRTTEELNLVGEWLAQNNLTVVVDASRVINVFPYPPRSFRLYKYMPREYESSMAMFLDVIGKLPAIGSRDLVMTLHQNPPTSPNVPEDMLETVRAIARAAMQHGATVHLRQAPKNDDIMGSDASSDAGETMLSWVSQLGSDVQNVKVALQTGLLIKHSISAEDAALPYRNKAATLLLVSGYNPGVDGRTGQNDDFSQASVVSMDGRGQASARELVGMAAAAGAVLVHDASFSSWHEALDDVAATKLSRQSRPGVVDGGI